MTIPFTILIVDDNPNNLFTLRALLKRLQGCEVVDANSGEQALARAVEREIHLILLDVQMPGMDGFETARHLQMTARTRNIPIVFITAVFKGEEFARRGYAIGAVDYLTKPIDDNLLLNRIHLYQRLYERERSLTETIETLRRHEMALSAASKEMEDFNYNIAHDLRAPLRAINGFSKILHEGYADRLDDEGKRLLKVVGDNAQKMGELIDDLLAFSSIGRSEVERSAVNMEDLAASVWEELKPEVAGRSVHLDIGDMPPAEGDPAMIHQVVFNLLSNAVKFTRHRADARIEVGGQAGEHETVYHVRDNGVGFNMQYADKLFGVFQRLHGMDEFEGTGIGLATVKRIVTKHGGRVWAEGKIGEGATVYFALPTGKD